MVSQVSQFPPIPEMNQIFWAILSQKFLNQISNAGQSLEALIWLTCLTIQPWQAIQAHQLTH